MGSTGARTTRQPASALGACHLPYFTDHLSREEALAGVEAGKLFSVRFRVNAQNRFEGYVTIPGVPVDAILAGLKTQNRAVEGDLVAVEVDHPSFWPRRKGRSSGRGGAPEGDFAGFSFLPRDDHMAPGTPLDDFLDASGVPVPGVDAPGLSLAQPVVGARVVPGSDVCGKPGAGAVPEPDAAEVCRNGEAGTGVSGEGATRDPVAGICRALQEASDLRPSAKVVAILEESRIRTKLVGILVPAAARGATEKMLPPSMAFLPRDPKFPRMQAVSSRLSVEMRAQLELQEFPAQHPQQSKQQSLPPQHQPPMQSQPSLQAQLLSQSPPDLRAQKEQSQSQPQQHPHEKPQALREPRFLFGASLQHWDVASPTPVCAITCCFGRALEREAEMRAILFQHDLVGCDGVGGFTPEVLEDGGRLVREGLRACPELWGADAPMASDTPPPLASMVPAPKIAWPLSLPRPLSGHSPPGHPAGPGTPQEGNELGGRGQTVSLSPGTSQKGQEAGSKKGGGSLERRRRPQAPSFSTLSISTASTATTAPVGCVAASSSCPGGKGAMSEQGPRVALPRRDLRHLRVFTIDPPTAKDLDDALSVECAPGGNVRIGVHIADVAHFVVPGSAVDAEARRRCSSAYFPDRVIPMLPPALCEQACSLRPGVDRLAFSILWEFEPETKAHCQGGSGPALDHRPVAGKECHATGVGRLVRQWMGKTVIRSRCQLAYDHVQEMIEGRFGGGPLASQLGASGGPQDKRGVAGEAGGGAPAASSQKWWERGGLFRPSLHEEASWSGLMGDVLVLQSVAAQLRARRFAQGAIQLSNSKLRCQLDSQGHPVGTLAVQQTESNRIVEEFMLLANMAVAQAVHRAFPSRCMLRCHPPPEAEKGAEFVAACKKILGQHAWDAAGGSGGEGEGVPLGLPVPPGDPKLAFLEQDLGARWMSGGTTEAGTLDHSSAGVANGFSDGASRGITSMGGDSGAARAGGVSSGLLVVDPVSSQGPATRFWNDSFKQALRKVEVFERKAGHESLCRVIVSLAGKYLRAAEYLCPGQLPTALLPVVSEALSRQLPLESYAEAPKGPLEAQDKSILPQDALLERALESADGDVSPEDAFSGQGQALDAPPWDVRLGHYALSVPLYTHFTSPIRRYADIVVHRQLAMALAIEEDVRLRPLPSGAQEQGQGEAQAKGLPTGQEQGRRPQGETGLGEGGEGRVGGRGAAGSSEEGGTAWGEDGCVDESRASAGTLPPCPPRHGQSLPPCPLDPDHVVLAEVAPASRHDATEGASGTQALETALPEMGTRPGVEGRQKKTKNRGHGARQRRSERRHKEWGEGGMEPGLPTSSSGSGLDEPPPRPGPQGRVGIPVLPLTTPCASCQLRGTAWHGSRLGQEFEPLKGGIYSGARPSALARATWVRQKRKQAMKRLRAPSIEEVSEMALCCNERRAACKTAQETAERLYLGLWLRSIKEVAVEACVASLGSQYATLFILPFGLTAQLNFSDTPGLKVQWFPTTSTVVLHRGNAVPRPMPVHYVQQDGLERTTSAAMMCHRGCSQCRCPRCIAKGVSGVRVEALTPSLVEGERSRGAHEASWESPTCASKLEPQQGQRLEPVTFPFTMRTLQGVPVVVGVDDSGDMVHFVVTLLA